MRRAFSAFDPASSIGPKPALNSATLRAFSANVSAFFLNPNVREAPGSTPLVGLNAKPALATWK